MLTPQQITQVRASAGFSPNPNITSPSSGMSLGDTLKNAASKYDLARAPVTPTNPVSAPDNAVTDTVNKTAGDYASAVPNFLNEAGRSDSSTNSNPIIRTAENALGATASGIGSVFAPVTNAIKSVADNFANTAKDPMNPSQPLYDNPVVGKVLDFFGNAQGQADKFAQDHPEAARNLSNLFTVGLTAAGGEAKVADQPIGSVKGIVDTADNASQGLINAGSKLPEVAKSVKQGISPSLSPEEATGQIIQGKTEDVAGAQRTLSDPAINDGTSKTYKDLQGKINSQIKPLAVKVDTELAKDPTRRPVSSFDKTIGSGQNATKINYVQEAVNNLKELYTNTSDAKGLSSIKAFETKIDGLRDTNGQIIKNATGITNKEVNDLSRMYNSEFGSKAFSKVSGDPLTSVNAQKFENIRSGLKDTARQGMGGEEAKALDAKLSDLYDTKKLIDKQVEKVNKESQKTPKQGVIPKTVGKIVKGIETVTGPIKAIGKTMGVNDSTSSLSPVEIEGNLSKNLKTLRK